MPRQAGTNHELLRMALIGYEAEIGRINAAIAEIRARLGKTSGDGASQSRPKKHTMSASGRERVAAAQRKRWAAVRKQGKIAAKPAAPKKRKLSAAGRKAIIEATRKRWAAYRKAGGKKGKAATASA